MTAAGSDRHRARVEGIRNGPTFTAQPLDGHPLAGSPVRTVPGVPGVHGVDESALAPPSPAAPAGLPSPPPGTPESLGPDPLGPDASEPDSSELGVLGRTAAIAGSAISASQQAARTAAALSERLDRATEHLLGAIGGGPPDEIKETRRLSDTSVARLDDVQAALHESARALRAFLRGRI